MSAVFVKLLEMSVVASVCILVVLILRLLLKRLPKIFSYVLWMIDLVRLLWPFAFESSVVGIQTDFYEEMSQTMQSDVGDKENPVLIAPAAGQEVQLTDKADESATPVQEQIESMRREMSVRERGVNICTGIWFAGCVGLGLYSVISVWKLKRHLCNAKEVEPGIYEAEELENPFLFGLLRPCIYLPSGLAETERSYIVAHEMVHKKRLDYLVKPLFYVALCLHWFNPLVWVAWKLMCKDMEMSCDEAVLEQLGESTRKEYSTVLLNMAMGNRVFSNVPLAFGENDTKARIKNVLSYKKPVIWVLAAVLILLVIASVMLLTNRTPAENVAAEEQTTAGQTVETQTSKEQMPTEKTLQEQTASGQMMPGGRVAFSDWLTYQLPKAQYIQRDGYIADIGAGGGELFTWTGESSYTTNGSENSAPMEWRAAGGVMLYQQEAFVFENGVLTYVRDISNHTVEVVLPELLAGCEEQAIIYQSRHDLYTAPELYMAEEAGTPIPENEQTVEMWYVAMTRENAQHGYLFFLSGRYFDKEDVIAFAKSVHFTEQAWITAQDEQEMGMMSDWVSYTVPKAENVIESDYLADGGYGYGGLYFEWTGENNYTRQRESLNADMWRKAGGVMCYPVTDIWSDFTAAAFEEGVLVDFAFHSLNHTSKVGITQRLDNCEEQAVMFKLNHDLFTAADVEEAKVNGTPIPENEQTANMWYVAFAREDAPYAYVFYLNERYYSREDVIAFAESARFTGEAWER